MNEQLIVVQANPDGSAITLFKYFSPTALANFIAQRLSLTPPKYLNDPFEFAFSREQPDRQELEAMFERFVTDEYEALCRSRRIKIPLADFKAMKLARREAWVSSVLSEDYRDAEPAFLQEQISQLYGVVCLTEVPDDLLMWAHYTDSYRGFVAEFRCDWEHTTYLPRTRGMCFGPAFKVEYTAKIPVFDRSFANAARCYSSKGEEWAYEREWRVVRLLETSEYIETRKGYRYAEFTPDCLKRVILGHRMHQDDKLKILEMLGKDVLRHVQLQEARPRPDKRIVELFDIATTQRPLP